MKSTKDTRGMSMTHREGHEGRNDYLSMIKGPIKRGKEKEALLILYYLFSREKIP